jgi:hypothetical protein
MPVTSSSAERRGTWAVVIVIVAFPLALALRGRLPHEKHGIMRTRQTLKNVENAVHVYALDKGGRCPTSLDALFRAQVINKRPRDSWGRAFVFRCPGVHNKDASDVLSKGFDGLEGTEDDIKNW